MSNRTTKILMAALGLAIPIMPDAQATTFLPYDLTSQLQSSQMVLEGRLDRVYPCPDPASGFPRTCALVTGQRFFKGTSATGKVTLFVPGGQTANGSTVRIAGAPVLRTGDVVLMSVTVKAGSDDMVALTNFDTALLKRVSGATGFVATNAGDLGVLTLPLSGRARLASVALPANADNDGIPKPAVPPLPSALSWDAAVRVVTDALSTVATTSSAVPAASIPGARSL